MSLPAEKIAAEPDAELSQLDKKTIYAEQASFLEQEDFAAEVSEFKVLGQVYNTFIAGIMDGKFWLVDQHTAQERINYENLGRIKFLSERSQQLLIPEIIDMSLSAMEFLETYSELFSDYGYDIEVFGISQIALRGVPAALPFKRAASIFKELAEELSEGRVSVNQNVSAVLKEKIRAMASCKAAVKAGDPLSIEAMTRLVNDMLKVEHSRYCPHGRPTRIILEEHVLERLFHRA